MVKLQVVSVNMHFDAILLQCLNKEILAHSSRSDVLSQLSFSLFIEIKDD